MVQSARSHKLERAGTWRSDHYPAAAPAARCPRLCDGRGVGDPLTHLLATRALIARDRATLLAGIAPDLAFYSTYSLWVLHRGCVRAVLDGGAWPAPPHWMVQLHRAGHSIPVALIGALLIQLSSGRWPSRILSAY